MARDRAGGMDEALRGRSIEELAGVAGERRRAWARLAWQAREGRLKKTHRLGELRRAHARALTALGAKRRAEGAAAPTEAT